MNSAKKETGLTEATEKAIINVVSSQPKAQELLLYGSRAKSTFRHSSDIDLVLKGEELTISDKFAIENELDDLMLPYKIDLALYQHIKNEDLLRHIDRVGLLLFDRKRAETTS